jgi:hypothetical protein
LIIRKDSARIMMAPWAVGKVAGDDRAHRQPAHAGPGEHRLGDHRAAQQERRLQADQRDHRDQRVAQRVMTITT